MTHTPVMLPEVLEHLRPADHEIYVDGTFGAGGYTRAILEAADCRVIAIDRDSSAIDRAKALKEKYGERLVFIHGCFGDVADLLKKAGFGHVDGFVLDLGVSSMQLDEAGRGFSFRFDGPLDMRMNQESSEETAADIVNTRSEEEIANLIYSYGEERHSRKIARKIVERRREKKFTTTSELAALVRETVPKSFKDRSDPATRTFQALRIAVNDELGELEHALEAAEEILKPGARMVVVTFHSLEDTIVKNFFRQKSGGEGRGSRYMPEKSAVPVIFELISRKAVEASDQESETNPRARSAKLRAAVKVAA